jgi:heme/copper-type cytochrome/quinol oxidase subunit 2
MFTNKNIKYVSLFLVLILANNSWAQCAMCRAVLESEEGGVKAEAVNDGIVYLMAFPYILLVVVSFVIYKIMKGKKKKANT